MYYSTTLTTDKRGTFTADITYNNEDHNAYIFSNSSSTVNDTFETSDGLGKPKIEYNGFDNTIPGWAPYGYGKEKFNSSIFKFPSITFKINKLPEMFRYGDNKTLFYPEYYILDTVRGINLASFGVCDIEFGLNVDMKWTKDYDGFDSLNDKDIYKLGFTIDFYLSYSVIRDGVLLFSRDCSNASDDISTWDVYSELITPDMLPLEFTVNPWDLTYTSAHVESSSFGFTAAKINGAQDDVYPYLNMGSGFNDYDGPGGYEDMNITFFVLAIDPSEVLETPDRVIAPECVQENITILYPPETGEGGGGDNPWEEGDKDMLDSLTNSGFMTQYCLSEVGLGELKSSIWGFVQDWWDKILASPLEVIACACWMPIDLTNVSTYSPKMYVGNEVEYEVECRRIDVTNVTVDLGSIDIPLHFNNYLDYTNTTLTLYLPYVGFVNLDPKEVMGKTISLQLRAETFKGSGLYVVICENEVMNVFDCNLMTEFPLSNASYSQSISNVIGSVGAGLVAAAATPVTGGASLAIGAAAAAANLGASTVANGASSINKIGGMGGGVGLLGSFRPYLIISRPDDSFMDLDVTEIMNNAGSYVNFVNENSGFTQIDMKDYSIDGATKNEIEMIKQLLIEGIII